MTRSPLTDRRDTCGARVKLHRLDAVAASAARTPPHGLALRRSPKALGRGCGLTHADVRNVPGRPAMILVRGISFGGGELLKLLNRHRVTVVVDDRREMEPFAAQFANGLNRLEGGWLRDAGRRVGVSCHDPIGHGIFHF